MSAVIWTWCELTMQTDKERPPQRQIDVVNRAVPVNNLHFRRKPGTTSTTVYCTSQTPTRWCMHGASGAEENKRGSPPLALSQPGQRNRCIALIKPLYPITYRVSLVPSTPTPTP